MNTQKSNWIGRIAAPLLLIAATVGGWMTRETWQPLLIRRTAETSEAEPVEAAHSHGTDRVILSERAQKNLRLKFAPAKLASRWSTVEMPGMVVERLGRSGRGVSAILSGVVTKIAAVPGDRVRPGDSLFVLRLASEALQTVQTGLYRTARELEINADEENRLSNSPDGPSLFRARLWELRYERRRQQAAIDAHRQDLLARGLTEAQIAKIAKGQFVTEITVPAPAADAKSNSASDFFEIEELRVQLGDSVQAGQTLCTLASHGQLDVEGRALEGDSNLIRQCADESRPIELVAVESGDDSWKDSPTATIRYVANHVDPASRTLPFFIGVSNPIRDAGARPSWRFRPGQRLRLRIPTQRYDGVFAVPADAVSREQGEAYVFRQNGDALDRRAVHVLHADELWALIANDGGITEGNVLVQNAAATLNRILKAKSQGGDAHGHGHDHHDHAH